MSVSDRERLVLGALWQDYNSEYECMYFRHVAARTGLTETQAKRSVRSLARKGYAEYVRGLFNDNGDVAGSGYRCTPSGATLFEKGEA